VLPDVSFIHMKELVGLFALSSLGWLWLPMILICITVVIAAKVLWIWMLIDALIHETDECNMRLLWTLVIIFTHWLGALIYLLVRRPERIRKLGK